MKKYLITGTLLAALAFVAPAQAKQDKTPVVAPEKSVEQATNNVIERVFNEAEKAIIEEYFGVQVHEDDHNKTKGKGHKGLPPGLAKKDRLPPGLEMQLERNGRLPPGLEKRELPEDLLKRLPPVAKGTRRIIAGNDILLVDETTDLILDVIRDVLKAQ